MFHVMMPTSPRRVRITRTIGAHRAKALGAWYTAMVVAPAAMIVPNIFVTASGVHVVTKGDSGGSGGSGTGAGSGFGL